jgi:putative addiction module component (TIGR02574 family)
MTQVAFDQIASQALALPAKDRELLVERLLTSLPQSTESRIETAWIAEIRERYSSYKKGELATIDAEEVFEKLDNDQP